MKACTYALIFVIACIMASCSNEEKKQEPFGDAEAIGSEDDANERINYEWAILHDPATGKIPSHMRARELAFAETLPHASYTGTGLNKTTAATWQSRGPWNVGGRTRAFAIDVSNENNLIAGTVSGGVWRSTDGGTSWALTTPVNTYQGATCLTQDTRAGHTNTWYFGSGESYGGSASATGASYFGTGIYKSTDGGNTWTVLSSTSSSNVTFDVWSDYVWNIVTDASNTTNDVVYAAAYGGIYKTTDGGANWTLVKGTFGSGDASFTDIAVTSTGIVYATLSSDGGQKGIYRSTDGVNFTDITPAGFPPNYNRIKIGICPTDETQVYFLGNTPGYGQQHTDFQGNIEWNSLWKYKYLSGNGSGVGGAWDDRTLNLPSTGGPFDKYQCQGSYDIVVKVKPTDTNTVFIGGTNLYRSTSGFKDATHTTFIGGYQQGATLPVVNGYLNHHPDQHDLAFFPSDANKMISVNDGGVYKTTDNTASTVAWTPLNNGYLSSLFYTCAIDHAGTNDIIIGGAQDNGSWYTNNANLTTPWVTPRGGDGSYCAIADNQSAYYFSIQKGKIMRAQLDGAGNITNFARIDPIGASNHLFINPFTLDPNNNNIMYMAAGNYLWRNNDLSVIPYAGNWDSISTNWQKLPRSIPATVTSVAVSKTPANRVYYGSSSSFVYRVDNANTGTPTATQLSGVGLPPNAYVSCVAVDPRNADNIIVAFSNYGVYSLYYSSNGGTNFSKIAGNLEEFPNGTGNGPSIRWVSIIPVNDGTVYMVGTSVGLFATERLNAEGTYWTQQATNEIGRSVVNMIDYRSTDGLVTVATHSHGIFSTHITSVNDIVGIKQVSMNAISDFRLSPNPFNDVASIKFSLKSKNKVSLDIYDEIGRHVRTIFTGYLDDGNKEYQLDAANLNAGIYYCTLRIDNNTETKKLVLAK